MPRKWSLKTDANQAKTIAALRAVGLKVATTHRLGQGKGDYIVGGYRWHKEPALLWVEEKSPGEKLTPAEVKFHAEWAGLPLLVVGVDDDPVDEILRWFGLIGS